tara:strand:- start:22 stop:489 length:468 start_codon:yes stop_codon:yes gene_type:complete
MEPQIIDHYNELPSYMNVIDKMNEEFSETQDKLIMAEWEIERLESTDDKQTIEELERELEIKYKDLEISREENENLKDKYQTLTGSFDNMKEFIETNYEGSEVVSSEYTKMCEDVLNLYKKKYGKEIEEKYMKDYNEKKNKEWWKGLHSFINMTM